jgi:hypothetical protein
MKVYFMATFHLSKQVSWNVLINHAFTHQDWLSIVVTITVDTKLLGLLHNSSREFNDNLMHASSHSPANGIRLVFMQSVFHLQDSKKLIHFSKFVKG